MVQPPRKVFRKYVVDGVPDSGNHNPEKAEIIALLEQLAGGTGSLGDYRGTWNAGTAYIPRDIVEKNGSLWWSLQASTNVTPTEGATWTLLLPGVAPADGSITISKLAADVLALIAATGGTKVAATRSAIKALDTAVTKAVVLTEPGREGVFTWTAGDYSAKVTADIREGIYVKATAIAASSGAWVRQDHSPAQVTWFGAGAAETAATNTDAINNAIVMAGEIILPPYKLTVDAYTGIRVKDGLIIRGHGFVKSVLVAEALVGGSMGELINYLGGSIIKRTFAPGGPNAYVRNCLFEDFGIYLNHAQSAVSTTAIQVGFDLRNITRSTINRCWVGNYDPSDFTAKSGVARAFMAQGYGVVCGNVAGGDPAYAGGECNKIINTHVWGAYRAITIDDSQLSPSSAAYGTIVEKCDIQVAQILIAQFGQYGAGCVVRDNVLQACQARSGDATGRWVAYFGGYGHFIDLSYVEAGACEYILQLAASSKNNIARVSGTASASSAGGLVADSHGAGGNNVIEYFANTGTGGQWISGGAYTKKINGA